MILQRHGYTMSSMPANNNNNNCDKTAKSTANVNFKISEEVTKRKYESVNELIRMCQINIDYYKSDKSFVGSRMCSNFEKIVELLNVSVPIIREIDSFAHLYDYDEHTPGNGYRSFIFIFDSALQYSIKICQYITENRASLLFRKSLYLK